LKNLFLPAAMAAGELSIGFEDQVKELVVAGVAEATVIGGKEYIRNWKFNKVEDRIDCDDMDATEEIFVLTVFPAFPIKVRFSGDKEGTFQKCNSVTKPRLKHWLHGKDLEVRVKKEDATQ